MLEKISLVLLMQIGILKEIPVSSNVQFGCKFNYVGSEESISVCFDLGGNKFHQLSYNISRVSQKYTLLALAFI